MKNKMKFLLMLGFICGVTVTAATNAYFTDSVTLARNTLITGTWEIEKKIDICHAEGETGRFHKISISKSALPAHLAHGDGIPNEGKFDENCKVLTLVDTVIVPATSNTPTLSNIVLNPGVVYLFKAVGTYVNTPYNVADAEYTSVDGWTTHADGYDIAPWILGEGEFDLQVNNTFVNWGAYNTLHEYTRNYTGTGFEASFRIFDGDSHTGTIVPSWYGDNSGSLTVYIYAQL